MADSNEIAHETIRKQKKKGIELTKQHPYVLWLEYAPPPCTFYIPTLLI